MLAPMSRLCGVFGVVAAWPWRRACRLLAGVRGLCTLRVVAVSGCLSVARPCCVVGGCLFVGCALGGRVAVLLLDRARGPHRVAFVWAA